jgi:integrase/recombinase XerC
VRAGVRRQEGALVHSLRHTYATFLLDSGASIREVQEALGHESLETTQRYLAVNAQGLVDAAHALPVGEMLRSSRGG